MSSSLSFFYSCVCNPYKKYTPWNWTRHTTACAAYKANLEAERTEQIQHAAEQAFLVEQAKAREAERVCSSLGF